MDICSIRAIRILTFLAGLLVATLARGEVRVPPAATPPPPIATPSQPAPSGAHRPLERDARCDHLRGRTP